MFDRYVTKERWHLFELCDLEWTPLCVKHACQANLSFQWTKRLPLVQRVAPADLVADVLLRLLDSLDDIDRERYTVIDFCSGAGGPTPVIERRLNAARRLHGSQPIDFRLSDLHPNIDAWMIHASHSAHLGFIPQPVDATAVSASVTSKTTTTSLGSTTSTSDTKTVHLFSLSFHHFPDATATRVLAASLRTSDVLVLVELQDRSLGALLLLSFEWALLLLCTAWWWPQHASLLHLVLTYWLPVLPVVQTWDGIMSCLRTRSFDEVLALVERALGESAEVQADGSAVCAGWRFDAVRQRHTWPFGYLTVFVGRRV